MQLGKQAIPDRPSGWSGSRAVKRTALHKSAVWAGLGKGKRPDQMASGIRRGAAARATDENANRTKARATRDARTTKAGDSRGHAKTPKAGATRKAAKARAQAKGNKNLQAGRRADWRADKPVAGWAGKQAEGQESWRASVSGRNTPVYRYRPHQMASGEYIFRETPPNGNSTMFQGHDCRNTSKTNAYILPKGTGWQNSIPCPMFPRCAYTPKHDDQQARFDPVLIIAYGVFVLLRLNASNA